MNTKTTTGEIKAHEMMCDEMGYFFGFARGCFSEVLGELSRTRINSFRTSSIPLAEFWQPANLGRIGRMLGEHLSDFNPYNALKFFEFPTDALFNGERIGRPSMTDIMILESGRIRTSFRTLHQHKQNHAA